MGSMFRYAPDTIVMMLLAMLLGCGGGSSQNDGGQGDGTIVVVTPTNSTVFEGETVKFQANVEGQTDQAVTWSVLENSGGIIDGTGLYRAPNHVSGRQPFHIVATSQAVPTVFGFALVTITGPEVTITPEAGTVAPAGTQVFSAKVRGLPDQSVSFVIAEASGGSVTQAGVYVAPLNTGFYHVVATSVSDPTLMAKATVTVTTSTSGFKAAGNPQHEREAHTATLLGDGRVLVAGGSIRVPSIKIPCFDGITFAELYDPAAGSFTATGNMTSPRFAHTATSLPNGEVLLAGGIGVNPDCEDSGPAVQSSAELYNSASSSFRATGHMAGARSQHTATLLPNGRVLIAAGQSDLGAISNSAELYDPSTGIFTLTGRLITPRFGHTATLLRNGKVLVTGGLDSTSPTAHVTPSAELYDPATGTFMETGSMTTARSGHTAIVLSNGTVLVTGGFTNAIDQAAGSSAELYNPMTGSFSPVDDMLSPRAEHTATLLPSGTVLVVGGGTPTAEVYDAAASSFTTTGSMATERSRHSATLLPNGSVLVIGGTTAELYK